MRSIYLTEVLFPNQSIVELLNTYQFEVECVVLCEETLELGKKQI